MKINNYILGSIKDLSLDQLKVFYLAICKRKTGTNVSKINYYEILDLFKHKKCSKQNLIDIVVGIDKRITIINFKNGNIPNINIFDTILFFENENEFYFKFNDNSIYLIEEMDENFSTIKIDELNSLKSKHTARFYELFRRYENMGIIKMKLEDIRVYFNLSETYSDCNLERVVIKESIKELKDKIGANISYKKEKRSGKITHYVFKFKLIT